MSTMHNTPLRYPGGKSKISTFLEDIIMLNELEGCVLYELYAGGSGASIKIKLTIDVNDELVFDSAFPKI